MRRWFCCHVEQDEDGGYYWKGSSSSPPPPPPPPTEIQVPSLSLEQLKVRTDNFGPHYLIAQVSGAKLYFAYLNVDNVVVVVKKLDDVSSSENELLTKVSMISKLKHENVVELLGYCVQGDVRCLAFEFATMGSLDDILHGGLPAAPVLDWMQRARVALDAARGLEYLHDTSEVHGSISSSNVLLFQGFRAKIADYDLLLLQGDEPQAQAQATRDVKLQQKRDVYMFGVVLLELLTGRKAVDERRLVKWVARIKDNVGQYVDPKLKGEYPKNGAAWLAAWAALCVHIDPHFRPSMTIIVMGLEKLQKHAAATAAAGAGR